VKGKILLLFPTCPYWKERFGIDIDENTFIADKKGIKKIPALLKRYDLTSCERMILESWIND